MQPDLTRSTAADRPGTFPTRRALLRTGAALGVAVSGGCVGLLGGGGGAISVVVTTSGLGDVSAFDAVVVDFDRGVLHPRGGDSVTLDLAERTVDLAALATDGPVTVVDAESVPAGEYAEIEFHYDVSTARLQDGTAVSFDDEPLALATGALGQYLTIESGVTTVTLSIAPFETEDGTWVIGGSVHIPP